MSGKHYTIRPVSKAFTISLLVVLLLFTLIASYSSFVYQRERLLLRCETALHDLYDFYERKVQSLSEIYVPIFRTDDDRRLVQEYFTCSDIEQLGYAQRRQLTLLLDGMTARDNDIDFILLCHPGSEKHLYLTSGSLQLQVFQGELPGLDAYHPGTMQLLGRFALQDALSGLSHRVFLLRGGAVPAGSEGGIFIGYRLSAFEDLLGRSELPAQARFAILNDFSMVFDSSGTYPERFPLSWIDPSRTTSRDSSGQRWYTGILQHTGYGFRVCYMIPWRELFLQANVFTPFILLILIAFALFALFLYLLSSRHIFSKVRTIHEGLSVIGGNHLDHRLPVGEKGDEFDEIADHINRMTVLLSDSIQKEYDLVKKQTQSELNQIQARFDPHFLYNTLEVIRSKLMRSGDTENAVYLEKLSRIFRNLTDAAPVTTFGEEIAFCSLYMSLLQLRYQDSIDIVYDIDPQLQETGILSHLIQPAIENYFMHALDESTKEPALEIIAEKTESGCMRITISDNGLGITDSQLDALNARLGAPVMTHGYGLMSIACRIRLFYGEAYGVRAEKNTPCGARIVITIPCMTLEEHKSLLGITP
ncbi:MAG: histidine kinase [Clostridia bacterium]|nr:histidine kinase [Clostridia bacterium]